MKNNLLKLAAFSIFLIGSTLTYAGNPCIEKKACTLDEFGMQATWVSYELEDKLANNFTGKSGGTLEISTLKHCLLMITMELAENLFHDPNKKQLKSTIDRKDYITKANKFKDNATLLKQIYPKGCSNLDLIFEDYSKLVDNILFKGRSLTDIDDLRMSPEKYSRQHVRLIGKGKFILSNFYLSKSIDDLNPIFIDLSAINSEEKAKLAKACGYAGNTCTIDIIGRVLRERSATSIVADEIWKY